MPHVHKPRLGRPLWLNLLILILVLLLFFVSIELMAKSINLFGSGLAHRLFQYTSNPWIALFIGMAATGLFQSSSATTSMVVAMVASGALPMTLAVPIVMGANIGTTVTNTLVSIAHINRSSEFRRAFAASTVHDMFNLLCVMLFFPIELLFGFFSRMGLVFASFFEGVQGFSVMSPLKVVITPVADLLLEAPATILPISIGGNLHGWLALLMSVGLLFGSILMLSAILKVLVLHKAENWFEVRLFRSAKRSFLLGLMLTVLVQSSSITTSLIVPIAAAGLLSLPQIYPYTLGANIGTTITAFLAALSTQNHLALAIAMVHTLFNTMGTLVFLPLRIIPITMATRLAESSVKGKWIPLAYVLLTFILIPTGLIFLLK